MPKKANPSIQIKNRRASFDYEFLETYTAGIVLSGTEIKSIRAGKCSLSDAYCYFDLRGQLYVRGMNVAQYFWGSWGQHEPLRASPEPGRQAEGPHHCRRPALHCRQRLRQTPHRPGPGQARIRQTRIHQTKRPPSRNGQRSVKFAFCNLERQVVYGGGAMGAGPAAGA